MPDQIDGLPLHPLVVHGAVVLIPLAALLGVLFVVPRTRAWARLPLLLVAVAAAGSAFVATRSGERLMIVRSATASVENMEAIAHHQTLGNRLFQVTIVYAVLVVIAFVLSRPGADLRRAVAVTLSVLLLAGAGGMAIGAVLVGHSGATAVWNPDGSIDYRSP